MRLRLIPLVLAAAVGCKREAPPATHLPGREVAPAESLLRGRVLEAFDASQYTYVRLQTSGGEAWAAVPTAKVSVGAEIAVVGPVWMENFRSNSLDRSWARIAFGTLEGAAPTTIAPVAPPAEVGHVNVRKAEGPQGRRIAEIYAQRTALKDRGVSVRGKVVKAMGGILGRNWFHLRDGSGEDGAADLTVTSTGEARVGETVVVSGVVRLDRDFGAGYHYDVLVEDATISKR